MIKYLYSGNGKIRIGIRIGNLVILIQQLVVSE